VDPCQELFAREGFLQECDFGIVGSSGRTDLPGFCGPFAIGNWRQGVSRFHLELVNL
jgi:hypothetical protein